MHGVLGAWVKCELSKFAMSFGDVTIGELGEALRHFIDWVEESLLRRVFHILELFIVSDSLMRNDM